MYNNLFNNCKYILYMYYNGTNYKHLFGNDDNINNNNSSSNNNIN